jgi:hypothetical protein
MLWRTPSSAGASSTRCPAEGHPARPNAKLPNSDSWPALVRATARRTSMTGSAAAPGVRRLRRGLP